MANRMFQKLEDRFGLAYSYCGLGNVRRMNGDYKNALLYFKKAGVLYKKIGDRVSYAYTLWSVGVTHIMLGKIDRSYESFKESDRFFKQTKDPRGRIYCMLGAGEADYMSGKIKTAKAKFTKALDHADRYGFSLEKGYAKRLLKAFKSGKGFPANLP